MKYRKEAGRSVPGSKFLPKTGHFEHYKKEASTEGVGSIYEYLVTPSGWSLCPECGVSFVKLTFRSVNNVPLCARCRAAEISKQRSCLKNW